MDDYGRLARELGELDAACAAERAAATSAYTARVTAAAGEVDHAELVVRQAEESVRAAGCQLDAIEERCGGLWSELGALLGRRGRRLGSMPEPATDPQSDLPTPSQLLDRASGTIARAALGEPIAPTPATLLPLLPPAGALAALSIGLPIRGILALTGQRIAGVDLGAEILIFFAPFAGVPVLFAWARHRYGARPDIGAAALTALGGMIASCALVLWLR
ncbi:MAG TPA: hypothetical protein VGF84_20860 [Micromonosporaceae bacterium]|jgi:hypothetical protein